MEYNGRAFAFHGRPNRAMSREIYQLRMYRARRYYTCDQCDTDILRGHYYYRDEPHPMARVHRGEEVRRFCMHCVDETDWGDAIRASQHELQFPDDDAAVVQHISVTDQVLRLLRRDPSSIYSLSADSFEVLVCDRLAEMGLEVRRTGDVNRKDGGIDIVFWNHGPIPILGAVQAKHHRSPDVRTGSPEVREFHASVITQPFQIGVVVTNTGFTADARWFASNKARLLRLRDGEDLSRWIRDEFTANEELCGLPERIELCSGVFIDVPRLK